MTKGYISLHRQIENNWLWFSEPFSKAQAWVDLLILASHTGTSFFIRGNRVDLKSGEIGHSKESLGLRWKWSRKKVISFLKMLEKEQQITQQKMACVLVVRIVNYDKYQKKEQQTAQQKSNRRATDCTHTIMKNNDNNHNNDNKKKEGISKKRFVVPSTNEISDYCKERNNHVDANKFYDFYESKGWKVGSSKMKDWKASVRTWENNNKKIGSYGESKTSQIEQSLSRLLD